MFILDTNVISELVRPAPSPSVIAWVSGQLASTLFLTAVTEAELRFGVEIMPAGIRRDDVRSSIDAILREDFAGRVLPFDSESAEAYASITATRRASGNPMSLPDAQIAAIAAANGMAVVTRNEADFAGVGVDIVNPWMND